MITHFISLLKGSSCEVLTEGNHLVAGGQEWGPQGDHTALWVTNSHHQYSTWCLQIINLVLRGKRCMWSKAENSWVTENQKVTKEGGGPPTGDDSCLLPGPVCYLTAANRWRGDSMISPLHLGVHSIVLAIFLVRRLTSHAMAQL